jgi:ribosome biogenesis GTPase
MTLASLGWDAAFAAAFSDHTAAGLVPARVACQHKHAYTLLSADGELAAVCTGKLLHTAAAPAELPAVGDWVAVRPRPGEAQADIHAVLPRRTVFSRRAVGGATVAQIVAANVDTVFLVTALDRNFNVRRIERYLAAAWESGAQPVVVLNKADLHPDPAAAAAEVAALAAGAPVVALSALGDSRCLPNSVTIATEFGTGPAALAPWLVPGRTVALLGSSGVGKSTLINRLLGADRVRTGAISDAVGKGRHTTTHRELLVADSGVLVIDTPGMRELQLWETPDSTLDSTFADIAALAAACRFGDCAHRAEPGCAIRAALEAGTLDEDRWHSFQKLRREQAYAARKADGRTDRAAKSTWKKINAGQRARRRFEQRLDD